MRIHDEKWRELLLYCQTAPSWCVYMCVYYRVCVSRALYTKSGANYCYSGLGAMLVCVCVCMFVMCV